MINPYGVQREFSLQLEEVERRQGQARRRVHEVGRARRRQEAAEAELRRSIDELPPIGRTPQSASGPTVLGFLRELWLKRAPVPKTSA